jgi:hypothetical protein
VADELAAVLVIAHKAVEARHPLMQPDDILVVAAEAQKVLTGFRISSGKLAMRPCLAAAASLWASRRLPVLARRPSSGVDGYSRRMSPLGSVLAAAEGIGSRR